MENPISCIDSFCNIITLISSRTYLERKLHEIIKLMNKNIPSQSIAIILINPVSEYLEIKSFHGLSGTFHNEFKRPIGIGSIAQMIMETTPFIYKKIKKESKEYNEIKLEYDFDSVMCSPIIVNEKAIGYVHCDRKGEKPFSDEEYTYFKALVGLTSIAMEKQKLNNENRNLSRTDDVTKALRFEAFLEKLEAELQNASYKKYPVSLGLIDLDNYKHFCRIYGCEKGQGLLFEVTSIIQRSIKRIDLVGRYGPDELIVSLSGLSKDNIYTAFNRVRDKIEEYGRHNTQSPSTVSIGVLNLEGDDLKKDVSEIIKMLSVALYRAQVNGKNQIYIIE